MQLCSAQDITTLERLDWDDEGRSDPEWLEQEREIMDRVSRCITWHVAPIVMLAHSRTNLPAKFRVFLHTLALLTSSRSELLELCQSVVSIHTDYGTEIGLGRVQRCDLDTILPYLHVPKPVFMAQQEDGFECCEHQEFKPCAEDGFSLAVDCEPEPMPNPEGGDVGLDHSLEGPDLMHIIHNITNNLDDIMDCYSPTLSTLKALCSLLAGRETKQQLIETCFREGPAAMYQDELQSFTAVPHDKRWNTIAAAIEHTHALEAPLRQHWSLHQFLGRSNDAEVPEPRPADGPSDGEPLGVNLRAVDQGISSDFFWGSITVLLQIAQVQAEAVVWVNSCPCHACWQHSTDPKLRAVFEACPLRGRRCAEMAAGDFFHLLTGLFEQNATKLELMLPRGLAASEIAQLMRDYDIARQHLLCTYVLKLNFWQHAPHALAGLAHSRAEVRVKCVQRCLASDSQHPRILELKNQSVVAEVFCEGGGMWQEDAIFDSLKCLAVQMRLMWTSAWRVEGQHARTKRAAQNAPHHSAAYTSLSHRLPELQQHLAAHPGAVDELARLMDRVTNGSAAVKMLGFDDDAVKLAGWVSPTTLQQWNWAFRVIYHDDPHSKYTLQLPIALPQRRTTCREVVAPAVSALEDSRDIEMSLAAGSVMLQQSLAFQDVRQAITRKTWLSMQFRLQNFHLLTALLSPRKEQIPALALQDAKAKGFGFGFA